MTQKCGQESCAWAVFGAGNRSRVPTAGILFLSCRQWVDRRALDAEKITWPFWTHRFQPVFCLGFTKDVVSFRFEFSNFFSWRTAITGLNMINMPRFCICGCEMGKHKPELDRENPHEIVYSAFPLSSRSSVIIIDRSLHEWIQNAG